MLLCSIDTFPALDTTSERGRDAFITHCCTCWGDGSSSSDDDDKNDDDTMKQTWTSTHSRVRPVRRGKDQRPDDDEHPVWSSSLFATNPASTMYRKVPGSVPDEYMERKTGATTAHHVHIKPAVRPTGGQDCEGVGEKIKPSYSFNTEHTLFFGGGLYRYLLSRTVSFLLTTEWARYHLTIM